MSQTAASAAEPLDVLIVGAGLSGIGVACNLARRLPEKRYEILEARDALGGTWDLFRYPGIRSDSDLYTFGYDFKPWRSDTVLAEGAEIRAYLREAAEENGVLAHIRYGCEALRADWDGVAALWTVTLRRKDGGEETRRARWLFCATGYYDYETGHAPQFDGADGFGGTIIHPQHWPDGFDPAGKTVAVIGSGATAITLTPALAERGAKVVQVQRTPSYVLPAPRRDALAKLVLKLFPEERAFAINRRRFIAQQRWLVRASQRWPKTMRRLIRFANRLSLPKGFDLDAHFNPPYDPWDQRLCVAADGDFFKALSSGKAEIVTGAVAGFTETGLRLEDGREVAADVVVTATGLKLKLFGGVEVRVNGAPILPSDKLVFRGLMLDGVPNFCFAVGYTTSSWSLKITLLCRYFCRLLAHMDDRGAEICVAERPGEGLSTRPLLDFDAGYVQRSMAMLPKQGDRDPWRMSFDYREDVGLLENSAIDDPALRFSAAPREDAA